jgi:hypothetical protein
VIVKQNPFYESLNIEISSNANDEVVLRLFGLDGKIYASQQATLQTGSNNVVMDNLSRLNSGVYVFTFTGKTQNTKINVIKK